MKEKIKCSECEFCRSLRPRNNSRAEFSCKHPNQGYIRDYFREHKMLKAPGFLNFGKPWSDEVRSRPLPHGARKSAKTNKSGLCVVFLLYVQHII